MKLLKYLSFMFLVVIQVGCSDDDNAIPATVIDTSVIEEDFNYNLKFKQVLDSEMSYVDVGQGNYTFVLIHGNPTSAYLWRNVIPHLEQKGRVIVPDLIGHGKSGKPDIDYSFESQYNYLNVFLESMNLENVILVLHDWGGGLGFHWANNHQNRVKGVAFFETLIGSYGSMEDWFGPSSGDPANPALFDIITLFRSGTENDTNPNTGWEAIVEQNMFIQQILPQFVLTRELTPTEMAYYSQPFELVESRKPLWKWPRELPINGLTVEGSDYPHEAILSYRDWLSVSEIPKFYLYATPGAANSEDRDLPWVQTLPNITIEPFGPGIHFLQEDNPHKIGQDIVAWFDSNF